MAYPAAAIANYFLQKGDEEERVITPLKLQKLVYFAHGWYLGLYGSPLINEQIECWPYGPVVPSLYYLFKHYGNKGISERALGLVYSTEGHSYSEVTLDNSGVNEDHSVVVAHLDEVWEAYAKYPATQLSNMTHLPGTPWKITYDQFQERPPSHTEIPQSLILKHFAERVG